MFYILFGLKVTIKIGEIGKADVIPFPAVTVCNLNPVPRSKLLCANFELATVDEYMPSKLSYMML